MKLKLLILLLISHIGISQERCMVNQKKNELESNPVMKSYYENLKNKSEAEYQRLIRNQQNGVVERAGEIRIPVAVHFPSVNSPSAALKSCMIALAQNQVDILNADFNATNSDISIWDNTTGSYFPGVNKGSLNVIFEIATQNHPAGMGLVNGDKAVTFGIRFGGGPDGDWDPDWAGYLNLVCENLTGGTLGYAYLASTPANGAAVFIDNAAFGSGAGCTGFVPGAPYNLGRTLTHELGHYLNMEHIWGSGTCGNDFVADTPQHNTSNGGCPAITHLSTCAGTPRELTMNYMDYTNDVCMYMFTAGQATRMQAHLNTIQSAFNLTTLSKSNFEFQNAISLYPNPNKGSFKLELPSNVSKYEVEVIDRSGRIVFSQEYTNISQDVNLNLASSGIYLIKIKANESVAYKKLIIE